MSDILRQVDEDIRKERISTLWKKYGLYLILVVVLIITAVLGFQINKSINISNNEKIVESYLSATTNKNFSEAKSKVEKLISLDNKYISSLSELKISNLLIEEGNEAEGVLILERIIQNNSYDQLIKDTATYFLLMLKIDELTEDQIKIYLTDEKIENSNFKYLFKELLGIKSLLLNDKTNAIQRLSHIVESLEAPLDIKIRANKFLELIENND